MGIISTKDIRNVCLLGHSGSGKTSLAEAMLYFTKATDRFGKTEDGNTVCDYDAEEIKRGISIQDAIAPISWKGKKLNIIDTPGYLDFVGDVLQATRVAGCALIVVDGKSGVEVGTELAWKYATEARIPKTFFVNKSDDPDAHFHKMLLGLRAKFGNAVCPIIVPLAANREIVGFLNLLDMKVYKYDDKGNKIEIEMPEEHKEAAERYRNELCESVAETSEEMMDKYFSGEEITRDEAVAAIKHGVLDGTISPVVCGSAYKLWSIDSVMNLMAESYPDFSERRGERLIRDGKEEKATIDPEGTPALFVFKTVADPFVGKMSYFKVMNGTVTKDMVLQNKTNGTMEKLARIYTLKGKKQTEVDALACGDIGMTAKLIATNTNDTLTTPENNIKYSPIVFPEPFLTMAIRPKAKGDEDKIASGISKLLEEDYTIKFENNAETKQLLLSGLGDTHIDVIKSKMKSRYNVDMELCEPKIAYREAIKKTIKVEGKHKKQSGGHGQYGHVLITFAPGDEGQEGLLFTQSVVGGSVPKNFYPAVEKGLQEAMQKGVLAGFPMVSLKADLYDGSYHDVDSSEMAFKIAANLAYKELVKANPIILEPVGALKATVPDALVGDVLGDVNKRRGRVLGIERDEENKGYQIVSAEVPKAEMQNYAITLRAMTQGRGSFTFYFERYEEAPANITQKIVADAAKAQ